MTIKGSASGAGGPAVSLLASPLHRGELAGLEPLTSCAFRQLMLQMELRSRPTPELNNWSAAQSFQQGMEGLGGGVGVVWGVQTCIRTY